MQAISTIYPELSQKKKIVITMHQKPDGDAMGSTLGLYHFLIQFGHEVQVISPTNWASFLHWMPGVDTVLEYEKSVEKSNTLIAEADWIFCLDFNVLKRTKNMEQPLLDAPGKRILIDHHQQPDTEKFAYGMSDPAKSSTCEMVYDFIVGSGKTDFIHKDLATCLYAGTMTDTGSFRFPSTSAAVHTMVARFKEIGMEHSSIHESLFDNFSENRLRFIGHILLNRLDVFYEYNSALLVVTAQDLQKYDIKTGDTEGLVNYPLSIEGIKLAAIIVDRGEERKCSFRSKGDFDVNQFARKYFSGGGHRNAAGGSSTASLDEVVQLFKQAIAQNKDVLSTYKF